MLGGGLEPPCLAAYAPQTYVSAISPPERAWKRNVQRDFALRNSSLCLVRRAQYGQGDLLRRELVDFDQTVARAAISAFDDGGVAARCDRNKNRRFEIVTRREPGVL